MEIRKYKKADEVALFGLLRQEGGGVGCLFTKSRATAMVCGFFYARS